MATKNVTICDVTGKEVDSHFRVQFTCPDGVLSLDLSKEGASRLVMAIAHEAQGAGLERALDSVLGPQWRSMLSPSRE